MPSLGADMEFGTLVDWRVKPGDVVKRGDVVALVETEKGVIEVEIFENGMIESLVVQPGQKVPVGAPLATLSGDGKKDEAPSEKPAAISPPPATPVKEDTASRENPNYTGGGTIRSSARFAAGAQASTGTRRRFIEDHRHGSGRFDYHRRRRTSG